MQPNLAADRSAKLTAITTAFALEMKELGVDFGMVALDPTLQTLGLRLSFATNVDQERGEAILETYLTGIRNGAAVKDFRQVDLERLSAGSSD